MKKLRLNNFSDIFQKYKGNLPLLIRRLLIGGGIAGLIIFGLQLLIPSETSVNNTAGFSQSYSLPRIANRNTQPKNETNLFIFDNAERYAYFDQNRQPLSTSQKDAIETDAPRISIVLNNIGTQQSMIEVLKQNQSVPLTIVLSPNSPSFNDKVTDLFKNGFEIWLNIHTIENSAKTDNGPTALNPARNVETNFQLLERQLRDKQNITGVTVSKDTIVTGIPDLWPMLVEDLFAQGYGILDESTQAPTPSLLYYQDMPAPYVQPNISLQGNLSKQELVASLQEARKTMNNNGNLILSYAVHTPLGLDILMQWVDSLVADGVVIIPLSAQAKL